MRILIDGWWILFFFYIYFYIRTRDQDVKPFFFLFKDGPLSLARVISVLNACVRSPSTSQEDLMAPRTAFLSRGVNVLPARKKKEKKGVRDREKREWELARKIEFQSKFKVRNGEEKMMREWDWTWRIELQKVWETREESDPRFTKWHKTLREMHVVKREPNQWRRRRDVEIHWGSNSIPWSTGPLVSWWRERERERWRKKREMKKEERERYEREMRDKISRERD